MKLQSILPLTFSFLMSLALVGFAVSIYHDDHGTALGLIAFVAGHWLGVGSISTGQTLSGIATSAGSQLVKDVAEVVTPSAPPVGS